MTINDRQIKFEMWVRLKCDVSFAHNFLGYRWARTLQVSGKQPLLCASLHFCVFSDLLFRALAPMYYRNADAAVLVYDVTDPV